MFFQKISSKYLSKPSMLLRSYVIISVISYFLIILLTGAGIYTIYKKAAIQEAEYDSVNISQALFERQSEIILNQLLSGADQAKQKFDLNNPLHKKFDDRMREYLHIFNIVKIKVFANDTTIVYSTDYDIIGAENKTNESLLKALQGEVSSYYKKKNKVWDLKGETRHDIGLVETYLPVGTFLPLKNKEKKIIGSFEIYMDISRYNDEIKEKVLFLTLLVAINLAVIGFALFQLMKKGTNELNVIQDELVRLSSIDSLTGVFNRRYLFQKAEEELSRIQFPDKRKTLSRSVGCILLDIDYFKRFNDTYGHLVGDEVLKGVAQMISETVRQYDVAGRYGGEEFLVFLPGADFEGTHTIAERIRNNIKKKGIDFKGKSYQLTVSAGISCLIPGDKDVETALSRADKGLYQAKERGRDRVSWVEGLQLG